jgi:hypothetical protein
MTVTYQDTRQRQVAQAIKWRNSGCLLVTMDVRSGLHPFQGRRQCAVRHSLEQNIVCLASCYDVFNSPCVGEVHWSTHSVVPAGKVHGSWSRWCNRPFLSIFLNRTRSTSAGHLPNSLNLYIQYTQTIRWGRDMNLNREPQVISTGDM